MYLASFKNSTAQGEQDFNMTKVGRIERVRCDEEQ